VLCKCKRKEKYSLKGILGEEKKYSSDVKKTEEKTLR